MAYKASLTLAGRNREDLDELIQYVVEYGVMAMGVHVIDSTDTVEYEDPDLDEEDE